MRAMVRSRRRFRRAPSPFNRWTFEAYFEPMWTGIKTIAQLRERYRQFIEDDSIWDAMTRVAETSNVHSQSLRVMEKSIKRSFAKK